jgi:hypothetical protein
MGSMKLPLLAQPVVFLVRHFALEIEQADEETLDLIASLDLIAWE